MQCSAWIDVEVIANGQSLPGSVLLRSRHGRRRRHTEWGFVGFLRSDGSKPSMSIGMSATRHGAGER